MVRKSHENVEAIFILKVFFFFNFSKPLTTGENRNLQEKKKGVWRRGALMGNTRRANRNMG